ncbi:Deoxyguanosinetriphosphate triphosphohydrolase-like protein [Pseudobythopirellula maris]|uniref:Deoxyguanosinetriphosphate triphosphohydrolase-like protein n=1 Tax=Pseudobythopirellula maris TaxID=2527991 RepID=A0A5C5ZUL3_9BACT|nr:HD domain-containing protein [Pseudobythopirellula maris]TWT90601.1 Deoxyguanosinetriphosphate triphosphohydrolase-like protein [Pseudobythopirellula maris]
MPSILDIPELSLSGSTGGLVRLPPGVDAPVTPRVRQLIDTAEFRRLASISQLGLVGLIYPGARHTRFEHSLGVYNVAIEYLRQLAGDERFAAVVGPEDAELLLVASLLHDLGHWPFCHAIEDMGLPGVPEHEMFANSFLLEGEVADTLRDDWGVQPRDVLAMLSGKPSDRTGRLLRSILSGPIDVDKVDYLMRDSLHSGVPYGQNFDRSRLIGSLCVNEAGDGLAITDKGKTAAEMMVFARYVMFSEVYWHHAVRSATAMLQRAFFLTRANLDLDALFRTDEAPFVAMMNEAAGDGPAAELLGGLFGPSRRLYKRLAQYSYFEDPQLYGRLARRPYAWLARCAEEFAAVSSKALSRVVAPHEVLFDAPPAELEVEFNVEVCFPKQGVYRALGDISPMVRTLAREQFDDYVKRVRIFVHPSLAGPMRELRSLPVLLAEAIDRVG